MKISENKRGFVCHIVSMKYNHYRTMQVPDSFSLFNNFQSVIQNRVAFSFPIVVNINLISDQAGLDLGLCDKAGNH